MALNLKLIFVIDPRDQRRPMQAWNSRDVAKKLTDFRLECPFVHGLKSIFNLHQKYEPSKLQFWTLHALYFHRFEKAI